MHLPVLVAGESRPCRCHAERGRTAEEAEEATQHAECTATPVRTPHSICRELQNWRLATCTCTPGLVRVCTCPRMEGPPQAPCPIAVPTGTVHCALCLCLASLRHYMRCTCLACTCIRGHLDLLQKLMSHDQLLIFQPIPEALLIVLYRMYV